MKNARLYKWLFGEEPPSELPALITQVDGMQKRILTLEKQVWELKNPPMYKVGDKIDKVFIVTEVNHDQIIMKRQQPTRPKGILSELEDIMQAQSAYITVHGWHYSTTNTKTGAQKLFKSIDGKLIE